MLLSFLRSRKEYNNMSLVEKTAAELSDLLKSKKVSAKEIVDSVYERIDDVEKDYNAYISLTKDMAYEQAKKVDVKISKGETLQPLEGIPISVKDNMNVKGTETTCASKILKGYYDVRILKSDVRGLSDSIHFNQETGLIKLLKKPKSSKFIKSLTDEEKNKLNPVIWFGKNQITGDKIFLKSNVVSEELDSLIIRGNVFMSQKDSLIDGRFNQIKGEKLDGYFNDGSLDNVYIVKNGTLLYYMYSDDAEFIGMNKTLASSILIKFLNNEISEVSFYKTPDGNVISENKIILNEMKLPGFIWREKEKPNNVRDLFSEEDKKLEIVEIE